jgi:hypothetical protein
MGTGDLALRGRLRGPGWEPACPSRWRAQDQLSEDFEVYGCGRVGVRGRLRGPSGSPRLTFKVPRRSSMSEPAGRFAHMAKCARIR